MLLTAKSNAKSNRIFKRLLRENLRLAGGATSFSARTIDLLSTITKDFGFSFKAGELQIINGNWYVTHTGLLRLARRKRCRGIHVEAVDSLCEPTANRFVLKATVFPYKGSSGFVGYGDADPSNVSFLVHGAEMRVAETRAVNRALRKAYGIGICSVEEIGSFAEPQQQSPESKKLPPQPTQRKCTALRKFAIASARLSVSINSIPTSSRRMRPTSAASRLFAMPRANKWKRSSRISPIGLRRTAMPCSASSIAIPRSKKKVPHEAPNHRAPRRRSLCCRPGP